MAGERLCIGDHVCLYSEEYSGYVYSLQSSSKHSEVAVQPKQDRDKPDVPDPHVITFEVYAANLYKLNKKYRRQQERLKSEENDANLKKHEEEFKECIRAEKECASTKKECARAKKECARAENENNIKEHKREMGKKVVYGQVIQLKHIFTGKYLHSSKTHTSRTESSSMQVNLIEYNARHAQFRILPRYKVRAEGDVVHVTDQVIFESVKTPGQYLNVSKFPFKSSSYYENSHELNLSAKKSDFTIYRRYKPEKEHKNYLKAGIPIRLFHTEIEAYLVAEGLFGDEVNENAVHLKVFPQANSIKSLYQATSSITYWQVEIQDAPLQGNVVIWEQQCRIRHLTTRYYLKVDGTTVKLTPNQNDPATVFRLHPVLKEKEEIEFETYCRLKHVLTRTWFNALEDEYVNEYEYDPDSDETSFAKVKWSMASLRQKSATMKKEYAISISVSEIMQYDDAFTLKCVDNEHVSNFYYMAGLVPCIQKLINDKKAGRELTLTETHNIVQTLQEIKEFMLLDGKPVQNRQMLFRDLKLVELMMKLLQVPYIGRKDEGEMTRIIVECYNVLYTYIEGDKKEQLYIARYFNFFKEQITTPGEIGLRATQLIIQLIKGNRQIVDRIKHEHIDQVIDLLNKNKHYHYLNLLGVMCECDGVAIPENQIYIAEKWMSGKDNKCVYHTVLGEDINKEKGIIYVSKDHKQSWEPLVQFSRGRNQTAIDRITKPGEGGFLTWEEAFLCLSNNELPDQLRAKYCSMIIVLFVDVGENTSVLDRVALTFIYEEVGTSGKTTGDKAEETSRKCSATSEYFPKLHQWISKFMNEYKDMLASRKEHNILIEQVLRLVHYLVKYGYYGDLDKMQELLDAMFGLINTKHDSITNENFWRQNKENDAVVKVKYQAMEIMDLFFNFRFNIRLKSFIEEFKNIHNQSVKCGTAMTNMSEFAPLLKEDYDMCKPEHENCNKAAIKVLKIIMEKSAYFKEHNIVKILLEQSCYDYKEMVIQSMSLINRWFSQHENLFKRAVRAQVLLTQKSCEVFKYLQQKLPDIIRLKDAKMSDQQTHVMIGVLDKLISFCHLEGDSSEEHPVNQNIIYNHEIVSVVLDMLSQDIEVNVLEQYKGMKKIYEKSLTLLKVMARENKTLQQRLFSRLDFLLDIKGAEHHLAKCLIEVFTGNKKTCMKLSGYQIQKITSLAATHKDPQFLRLLEAIVVTDELNLPLKRNQDFVMKFFMQFRSELAYAIDKSDDSVRSAVLSGENVQDLEYFICLLDLLASCAEGENKFTESICQTMFEIPEILKILNSSTIGNKVKRPLLRFLLWAHMNTSSEHKSEQAMELLHNNQVWKYINHLNDELQTLTTFVKQSPDVTKKLLKKTFQQSYLKNEEEPEQNIWLVYYDGLHYIFDAVLPFLKVFFKHFYQRQSNGGCSAEVKRITQSFGEFTRAICHQISNPLYIRTLTNSMNVMVSVAKVTEDFGLPTDFAQAQMQLSCSNDRKKYDDYYQEEVELNKQLNIFTNNYRKIYGGFNDVKSQIDFTSKHTQYGKKKYIEVGSHEDLPLGPEFQQHMKAFTGGSKEKYKWCKKLTEQLASSLSEKVTVERRLHQDILDIKCLQLLRGMIHNEIVKLPFDWEWKGDDEEVKKILSDIKKIQREFNKLRGVLNVLDYVGTDNDDICREILSFLAAMLFGGNEDVQKTLENYFLSTSEEFFFHVIKKRINRSIISTKERRALMSQHSIKLNEELELQKLLRRELPPPPEKKTILGQMKDTITSVIKFPKQGGVTDSRNQGYQKDSMVVINEAGSTSTSVQIVPGKQHSNNVKVGYKKTNKPIVRQVSTTMQKKKDEHDDLGLDYQDDNYIELVLRVIGLMCDGQNKALQNYFREQPDNIKSVNLVAEVSDYLALMYGTVDQGTINLVTQLFETLVEFVSGNAANQTVVFDNKVCNYINHVLRCKEFTNCSVTKILQLKLAIGNLINAMIEETTEDALKYSRGPKEYGLLLLLNMEYSPAHNKNVVLLYQLFFSINKKDVAEALDHENIWRVSYECYMQLKEPCHVDVGIDNSCETDQDNEKREKELCLMVGFKYFHVLLKIRDIDHENRINREQFLSNNDGNEDYHRAWNHYHDSTMSIEIVKDGELQKIYFRCKDQGVLREEAKEKFNYTVSRSIPSTKLREFMDWSHDIIQEIKYTKRIFSNPLSCYFVKFWWTFNMLMIFLSFVFSLIIMFSWVTVSSTHINGTHVIPNQFPPEYDDLVGVAIWTLGGMHNLITLCVLISYFISNRPRLPRLQWFRKCLKMKDVPVKEDVLHNRKCHKTKDVPVKEEKKISLLQVDLFSFTTLWYIFLFLCSLLGTVFYGYFFAVHLLHIAMFNPLLKQAIFAITKNGLSLLWIFIYGIIVIWIYTLVIFALYGAKNATNDGLYCGTMYEFFMTTVHTGLVKSMFDLIEVPENSTFGKYLPKMLLDLTFFIVITTIGLNIVLGIIVNTFSELRSDKVKVDNDMKSMCFICSRSSYDFETQGGGFEKHVKEEHNQWAYVFFFIHLDETRINDYTALELYVHRLKKEMKYDFFPLKRALSLAQEEKRKKIEVDTVIEHTSYMLNKMKKDELMKQREEEKRRQLEWERKHKEEQQ